MWISYPFQNCIPQSSMWETQLTQFKLLATKGVDYMCVPNKISITKLMESRIGTKGDYWPRLVYVVDHYN